MTEMVENVTEPTFTDKVVDFGLDGVYLGLGVVSVVRDGVQNLVKRGREYRQELVERGEKLADQNRGRVNDVFEQPRSAAKGTVKRANETFEHYSEQVLTRAHIPTAESIEAMTRKVNAVDRKLDKIIKENAAAQQI